MTRLTDGTLTFLFTDVEGSTRLWERYPDLMREALLRHEELVVAAVESCRGHVVRSRGEGDSFFTVFRSAADAVAAACAFQQALHAEPWPPEVPIRVRVAAITGEAEYRDNAFYGSVLNRCARIRSLAHGGQTLIAETTYALVRDNLPEGVSLRDMGVHRLKDLLRPEHVHQVDVAGLPADFPPLASLDLLPNNLPQQLTSFIGREKEIVELRRLLDSSRLLTIVGAGGAGKTRIALQAAADCLDAYRDGVWLVELADLTEPGLVAQRVALALKVREEPGTPVQDSLAEHLRTKRLLLLLDNCEHLVEASARLLHNLLRTCPELRVLATSREPLGVPGEAVWRIPTLAIPESTRLSPMRQDLAATLSQFDAVRLFVERATLAAPAFRLSDRNAPAVAQICRELDGIPLALELGAARVKVLSVEQIAARLNDRFRLLRGGSRTALPRHQTLEAAVDWSHSLLSESERTLLRRLSVFAGGWTLEAAEAVCGYGEVEAYEVLDLTAQLVDRSLVIAEAAADAEPRYRMLETIRQYASARLAELGEREEACRRHRDHFLALADEAESELRGVRQAAWMERLETELDNLRAAMGWSLEADPEAVLRFGHDLFRFWHVRGYLSEGRSWLERGLAATADSPIVVRARALNAAGSIACAQADYLQAASFLEGSLTAWRALPDCRGEATALSNLGNVFASQGDPNQAEARYRAALGIYRALGDTIRVASVLCNLGTLALSLGDCDAARGPLEEAVAIQCNLGDHWLTAAVYRNLGRVAYLQQRFGAAESYYCECLDRWWKLRDRQSVADTLHCLGSLALASDRLGRAALLFGASAALRRELGVTIAPCDEAQLRLEAEALESRLGSDEYDRWYHGGETLPLPEVICVALGLQAVDGQS